MLPENVAVVAHGVPLSVAVPVTELPFCCSAISPVTVSPKGVEFAVNCQFPVKLWPEVEMLELLLPQPARQTHDKRMPSIFFTYSSKVALTAAGNVKLARANLPLTVARPAVLGGKRNILGGASAAVSTVPSTVRVSDAPNYVPLKALRVPKWSGKAWFVPLWMHLVAGMPLRNGFGRTIDR
jgi:hypothetical protein